MKVHLVSYATPRFRHRQVILGLSARLNRVADVVHAFSPAKVLKAGFAERCPGLSLSERGSGFWAWKPYIIHKVLSEVPDGDVVFYCDVGRRFPFKQLTGSIRPYLEWMEACGQDVMPGVGIPWKGLMSMWTKRDAFIYADMDHPATHAATPIQASFSFWKASPASRALADGWLDLASRRHLISDDPGTCGVPELPDFHDHRHDQSLLTLCCLKQGIRPLDIGHEMQEIDTQHPSEVSQLVFGGRTPSATLMGRVLSGLVRPLEIVEERLRRKVSFGEPLPEPEVAARAAKQESSESE